MQQAGGSSASNTPPIFCHDFDLGKRLTLPSSLMQFVGISTGPNLDFTDFKTTPSPFTVFITHLMTQLSTRPSTTVHRVVIPTLLSPALYPAHASRPENLLQFFHALR